MTQADSKTLAWYAEQGASTAARYEAAPSPLAPYLTGPLAGFFPSGCRVLDIGCGSGRDLALLLSNGFDAWGLDPSATMLAQATALHPGLKGRLFEGGLPDTGLPAKHTFDAVICMASFMHVPQHLIHDAAQSIARLLNAGGYLLISVPLLREGLDDECREPGGRLFTPLSADALRELFEGSGFVLKHAAESGDALARDGVRWMTLLFSKLSAEA